MESSEGPSATTTTTTATVDLVRPPPHDPDSTPPVGFLDETGHADLRRPSDNDHEYEQDHGEDHDDKDHDDKDHGDHLAESGVLTGDLKGEIIKQIEYYFSDENMPTDNHLLNLMKKNKEGFVPISIIASFRKMKKLTRDYASIVTALKESSLLVVSSDGKKVKRLNPLPEVRDPKLFTVLVENLPEDHSVENMHKIFGEAGGIKSISIHDPHAMEEAEKGGKEKMISTKLHALVEYETVGAAEKAAATLSNEQDWRNGLRVKLLKRVGKFGHRRQACRETDTEKSSVGWVHEQTGGEENRKTSEHRHHHHDTPDEEVAVQRHKDKNGHKGRNRGRPSRQNYQHGNNGLGHGTTSSSSHHPFEVSKPPPGPRMPDGTRGFTMGRGRPPPTSTEPQHSV